MKSSNIKKSRHLYFVLLFVCYMSLAFFSGFRVDSGADYQNYEYYYSVIEFSNYQLIYEPVFFLIFKYAPSFNFALFLVSLLTNLLIFIYSHGNIKRSLLFFIILVLSDVYLAQFNIIRQMLSFSVLLFFVHFLEKGNVKKCLLMAMLAISCHYGSLIFIVFTLMVKQVNLRVGGYIIISFVLCFVFMLGLGDFFGKIILSILPSNYSAYADSFSLSEFNLGLRNIIEYILLLMLYILSDKDTRNSNKTIFKILMIGFSISFIAMSFPILYRVAYYFIFFKLVFIAQTFRFNCSRLLINKIFLFIIIMLFYSVLFYLNIYNNTFGVFPYKNYYL
ncbi:EpsG family protein [Vibrio cyclitrophicus]|uniref:EpsG family protein n=1 Tax=Vibrio cyclitrophicus TaxID=47951 RepID=UPI0038B49B7F